MIEMCVIDLGENEYGEFSGEVGGEYSRPQRFHTWFRIILRNLWGRE